MTCHTSQQSCCLKSTPFLILNKGYFRYSPLFSFLHLYYSLLHFNRWPFFLTSTLSPNHKLLTLSHQIIVQASTFPPLPKVSVEIMGKFGLTLPLSCLLSFFSRYLVSCVSLFSVLLVPERKSGTGYPSGKTWDWGILPLQFIQDHQLDCKYTWISLLMRWANFKSGFAMWKRKGQNSALNGLLPESKGKLSVANTVSILPHIPLGLSSLWVWFPHTQFLTSSLHVFFLCLKGLFSPMGGCSATAGMQHTSVEGELHLWGQSSTNRDWGGWINAPATSPPQGWFCAVPPGFSEDSLWDWVLVVYSLTMEHHSLLTHSLMPLNKAHLLAFLPFLSHFSQVFFCAS